MRMIDSNRISAWPHLPHVSTVRGLHANGNWVGGFAGQRIRDPPVDDFPRVQPSSWALRRIVRDVRLDLVRHAFHRFARLRDALGACSCAPACSPSLSTMVVSLATKGQAATTG